MYNTHTQHTLYYRCVCVCVGLNRFLFTLLSVFKKKRTKENEAFSWMPFWWREKDQVRKVTLKSAARQNPSTVLGDKETGRWETRFQGSTGNLGGFPGQQEKTRLTFRDLRSREPVVE